MITADDFMAEAARCGFDFYAGVPCSFLTPLINGVISSPALRYVGAAIDGEYAALAGMGRGSGRNVRLFQAAANLYGFVAADLLPEAIALDALERAASDCGLVAEDGLAAVRATIASGAARGLANPREVAP